MAPDEHEARLEAAAVEAVRSELRGEARWSQLAAEERGCQAWEQFQERAQRAWDAGRRAEPGNSAELHTGSDMLRFLRRKLERLEAREALGLEGGEARELRGWLAVERVDLVEVDSELVYVIWLGRPRSGARGWMERRLIHLLDWLAGCRPKKGVWPPGSHQDG